MHEEQQGFMVEFAHHLREIGPEFLLAWAGWLVHSFVHTTGHILRRAIRIAYGTLRRLL